MTMATVTTDSLVSVRIRGVLIVVILHFVFIPPVTAISEPGKWIVNVDNVNVSASPTAVFWLAGEILTLA